MKRHKLAIGVLLVYTASVSGDEPTAFSLDHGLRLRQFISRSCCDVTRDGSLVAVAMKSRESFAVAPGGYTASGVFVEANGGEIWLCDTHEKKTWKLTESGETSWAPRWSPDATQLAYFSDRDGKPQLHIWDRSSREFSIADGRLVRTTFVLQLPEWSPDSRYVYFHALSPDYEANYGRANVNWPWQAVPFIPYKTEADKQAEASEKFVTLHKAGPVNAHSRLTTLLSGATPGTGIIDLVRFDTKTRSFATILSGQAINDFDVSPDGNWAVVSLILGEERLGAMQPLFRLLLIPTNPANADQTKQRVLVEQMRESWGVSMSWSPDSRRIAFLTSGHLSKGDLEVIDVDSGEIRNLTEDLDKKLTEDEDLNRPIWSIDGKSLFVITEGELWRFPIDGTPPDNLTSDFAGEIQGLIVESEMTVPPMHDADKSLLCQFRDTESLEHGFCQVNLRRRTTHVIHREAMEYPDLPRFHVDIAPASNTMVYRAIGRDTPGALKVADMGFMKVETMPSPNDWLKEVDLGRLELLSWTLPDGVSAKGILLLPSKATQRAPPPCIVSVYPGSRPSRSINDFAFGDEASTDNPRFFLSKGYAVFLPDLPIGDGPDPMKRIWEVTRPALSALEKSERVDMQRLGVFGHSYGGYGVNSLVVQTTTFRAAVSSTGASNLTSAFFHSAAYDGNTGWFESGQGRMGVSIWEDPDRYVHNSPIFYLRNVETPMLFLHGERDVLPGAEQSAQMFGGLRRLGKVAEMAVYSDAGHWYGSTWSEAQLRDFWKRVMDWFDRHLET